jgi:hypothetical protein
MLVISTTSNMHGTNIKLTEVSKNHSVFISRFSQSMEEIYREGEKTTLPRNAVKVITERRGRSSVIIWPSIAKLLKAFFQKVWYHNSLISSRPSPLTSVIARYIFTINLLPISQNHRRYTAEVNTSNWTIKLPDTKLVPLLRKHSDHASCRIAG